MCDAPLGRGGGGGGGAGVADSRARQGRIKSARSYHEAATLMLDGACNAHLDIVYMIWRGDNHPFPDGGQIEEPLKRTQLVPCIAQLHLCWNDWHEDGEESTSCVDPPLLRSKFWRGDPLFCTLDGRCIMELPAFCRLPTGAKQDPESGSKSWSYAGSHLDPSRQNRDGISALSHLGICSVLV